jgi:hypothetical protein
VKLKPDEQVKVYTKVKDYENFLINIKKSNMKAIMLLSNSGSIKKSVTTFVQELNRVYKYMCSSNENFINYLENIICANLNILADNFCALNYSFNAPVCVNMDNYLASIHTATTSENLKKILHIITTRKKFLLSFTEFSERFNKGNSYDICDKPTSQSTQPHVPPTNIPNPPSSPSPESKTPKPPSSPYQQSKSPMYKRLGK